MGVLKVHGMSYLNNLNDVNAFDSPSSPLLSIEEFSELIHKTLDNLWANKEKDNAGWLLLVSSSVEGPPVRLKTLNSPILKG